MVIFVVALVTVVGYTVWQCVYNAYFHPLARFPGPFWHGVSYLPRNYYTSKGIILYHIQELHEKYGPIIRLTPNELSFSDARAWRDIYHCKSSEKGHEIPHSMSFYNPLGVAASVLSSDRESHDTVRKILSPGFSERAWRSQELMFSTYADLLMDRLSKVAAGNKQRVNIRDWLAWYAFDVAGQLVHGSDFGCLRSGKYHPWIRNLVAMVQDATVLQAICDLGFLPVLRYVMLTLGIGCAALREHNDFTRLQTQQRINLGTDRHDYIGRLLSAGLRREHIDANGGFLVLAGSETVATSLAGTVYLLATHPSVMKKLQDEIRGRFYGEEDITITSVATLGYLMAVIKESLRIYPPVAAAAPREVNPSGSTITGEHVPGGTIVGVWHYVVYRNETYFRDAKTFDPERFMPQGRETGRYANDRLDSFYPFLLGPRNCLGQALAYAEMRLVLARLVWRFDIDVCDESKAWLAGQQNFVVWQKPELYVYLKRRDLHSFHG